MSAAGASPRNATPDRAFGRRPRRMCSLQVFGGIGFTAEHDHHHLHSRVLALDGLLGTSAEVTYQLGHQLRTTGIDPGFPAAMIGPTLR